MLTGHLVIREACFHKHTCDIECYLGMQPEGLGADSMIEFVIQHMMMMMIMMMIGSADEIKKCKICSGPAAEKPEIAVQPCLFIKYSSLVLFRYLSITIILLLLLLPLKLY